MKIEIRNLTVKLSGIRKQKMELKLIMGKFIRQAIIPPENRPRRC